MTPVSIARFDSNAPGAPGFLFGLPFSESDARTIIIPAPWEATVSSGVGAALAPRAILEASLQIDLFVEKIPDAWQAGICMAPLQERWEQEGARARALAERHIRQIYGGGEGDFLALQEVNRACEVFCSEMTALAVRYLDGGKTVGVLGGDHSTPLGLIRVLADRYAEFGILQIDAHADLRAAYEGFLYSHASIMHNALQLPAVCRLVQVGLRDYCQEERNAITRAGDRVAVFDDDGLKENAYRGVGWLAQCDIIVASLPERVYISFDVDGLDPALCPGTGTPVPGGLSFHQAATLIERVARSGRTIIGFDLNEVGAAGPNPLWDANVGARLLYALCNWTAVSQGALKAV